ncbi:hypothetical protein MKK70_02980 [Methylobacterium sp. E-041]|jgi:hypothetical protein|uniref:hypothetical protein n=1 Tax=unclassified Methylobacterium TaxID=2615210 RepID=UPI001FB95F0A|nr:MULTISPECIES: hypothetical protein [unclassified Methylobacterium]MCJ2104363.1 hypothetical protein [Methylobacterium sp. E-041]MCJ2110545.1 hypothetical protein [Methylobacterium sp. E-025]
MSNVITFRPRATVAQVPPAPSPAETRRMIEEAAQSALDTADSLLAILDRIDGDADIEGDGEAEPSLAAPENHHVSQVVWMRGNDADREAEAPEVVLPVVVAECAVIPFAPLPWGGRGNILTVAGVALLDMVAGGVR